MDMNCAYCAKGELVAKFGYEVCELPVKSYIWCKLPQA